MDEVFRFIEGNFTYLAATYFTFWVFIFKLRRDKVNEKYRALAKEIKRLVLKHNIKVIIPKPIPVTDFPGQRADLVFGLPPRKVLQDPKIENKLYVELVRITDRQIEYMNFNLKDTPTQRLGDQAVTVIPAWVMPERSSLLESGETCAWCGRQLNADNYCESCGAPR